MSDENLSSIVTSVAIQARKIKTGKRALLPNGKPKPLPGTRSNKAGMIVLTDGQLGAPTHQERASKLIPRDPSRMSVENQIAALKRKIEQDLRSVVSLTQHGRIDKAVITCGIIATSRNRLVLLAEQASQALAADPVEDTQAIRKSPIKVQTKVKRYKPWSDK